MSRPLTAFEGMSHERSAGSTLSLSGVLGNMNERDRDQTGRADA